MVTQNFGLRDLKAVASAGAAFTLAAQRDRHATTGVRGCLPLNDDQW